MSFNHALQRQGAPRVCRKVAGHPSSSVPAWPQYPALAAFAMQPVDRPFRFTQDFCIVWAHGFTLTEKLTLPLPRGPS